MPRLAFPVALLATALLSGCGNSGSELKFAPACPQLSLLAEGAELTRFAGAGRDVTDRVLEARIAGREFVLNTTFPANVDALRAAGDELDLNFPEAGERGAGRYRIIVSLQLTEEELAYNRRAAR
jgi:hypothetical protein